MKNLNFLLAAILISGAAYSQPCIPDTSKHNTGMYPAGGTVDTVYVGLAYNESVTYVTLDDTTITVTINPAPPTSVTARLDSVAITNWSNSVSLNLPTGLVAACNTGNCVLPGNSANCVRISGLVSNVIDTGTYLLNLNVTYYFTILSSPFTGVKYSLPATYNPFSIIVKTQPSGSNKNLSYTSAPTLYPNPGKEQFTLKGLPDNAISEISLYDIAGKLTLKTVSNSSEFTCLWPPDAAPGMYLLRIKSENASPVFYHLVRE